MLSDEHLVRLVRGGNMAAFEAIYDRHHRPILSFARHMLGSREDAEDATQHVFISAHRALCESGKAVELRPWLFTIARNRCISILRSRREHAELVEERAPSFDGLAAEVQRREDLRELVADVERLPDDQRAAIVLAEVSGLAHPGIAEAIGCPPEKVKALVFQARESLMASKQARELDCREVREEMSVMRGAGLRRRHLQRHLRSCEGCREFRAAVASQRRALAIVLPVMPTLALKHATLGGIAGLGAAGGGGGVGAAAATGHGARGLSLFAGKSFALKGIVVAALGLAAGGGVAVLRCGGGRSGSGAARAAALRITGGGALAARPPAALEDPIARLEHAGASGSAFSGIDRAAHREVGGAPGTSGGDIPARSRTRGGSRSDGGPAPKHGSGGHSGTPTTGPDPRRLGGGPHESSSDGGHAGGSGGVVTGGGSSSGGGSGSGSGSSSGSGTGTGSSGGSGSGGGDGSGKGSGGGSGSGSGSGGSGDGSHGKPGGGGTGHGQGDEGGDGEQSGSGHRGHQSGDNGD